MGWRLVGTTDFGDRERLGSMSGDKIWGDRDALGQQTFRWVVRYPPSATRRSFIIFDQLNPAYANYDRNAEVEALFAAGGFTDI
jgi:hypothetical protein